ncbi:MliC family protein [Dyella sp. EPa41]|uniref:MliC family protein n=1 Tax=Dyella sp. EPa41 TaxID=1561194 RepID=UPI0019156080|nr:MliC family protein [Dyella sp. EPa41]
MPLSTGIGRHVAAGLMGSCLLCGCTTADTFHVPGIEVASTSTHAYQCEGGKALTVTYWNSQSGQGFALLAVDGKPMLFVDTIAASGVKYMAGRYTWWTKGERGDLYDALAGPNAAPVMSACMARTAK